MIPADPTTQHLWAAYVWQGTRAHAWYMRFQAVEATRDDFVAAAVWEREQQARRQRQRGRAA